MLIHFPISRNREPFTGVGYVLLEKRIRGQFWKAHMIAVLYVAGIIPKELGALTKLEIIVAYENQLTGEACDLLCGVHLAIVDSFVPSSCPSHRSRWWDKIYGNLG